MTSRLSPGDPRLATRLRRELEGEVYVDPFTLGRYSTDASFYQIEPLGVVLPRTEEDVVRTIQIATEEDLPVLPRGAGTSQAGQAVGRALIVDTSKYLTRWTDFDRETRTITVEPGVVLDHLNAFLAPHGLWFPVDVATSAQATLGGMAGNNSAGARSLRYGLMVDNVRSIDAVLADGARRTFGQEPGDLDRLSQSDSAYRELVQRIRTVYMEERDELMRRVPTVLRHVAGYNLHRVSLDGHNMAHLLVGSEGTLGFFTSISLSLAPLPRHRVLGVCHFGSLRDAMDAVQHIVTLQPTAVELVDRTLLDLAGENPMFRRALSRFVSGEPAALLLVEFAGDQPEKLETRLQELDLVLPSGGAATVVHAVDPRAQAEIWSVRKAGLNIVMSMRGDRKPVSFIEDCAVPLEHLAEYTSRLTDIFHKYGTSGTFYAHASVGCLHVRPALNLKSERDITHMRRIADEAHALVREFKGSHSGEHGDGLVRSEFLEPMLGPRIARAFATVKEAFDPAGRFNPGKIVRAPRMDDRTIFRYGPDYGWAPVPRAFDWSDWNGWHGAVEMCNNNGACRKRSSGVMCPSYRVTGDEVHVTRGRANTLRLALTGQLGHTAITSDEMYETMELCVSCKACRTECPMGVDMARMKIEFLRLYYDKRRVPLRTRLVAHLPRYAPWAAKLPKLFNLRDRVPGLARVSELALGLSAKRRLPAWRRDAFRDPSANGEPAPVVLFVDTFNRYYEPENVHAAIAVLRHLGHRIAVASPRSGGRPLCCGRTYLNAGFIREARAEAKRVLSALEPHLERGGTIVGLEPSCLLTFRDELNALVPGTAAKRLGERALLFEEFLATTPAPIELQHGPPLPVDRLLVHGHCHQKAFGAMDAVRTVLEWIPHLRVEQIESSCCGMAGSFGYEARHQDVSMAMGELSLFPAVRAAGGRTWIVADGTSCRRQIEDGTGRESHHVAQILSRALGLGGTASEEQEGDTRSGT